MKKFILLGLLLIQTLLVTATEKTNTIIQPIESALTKTQNSLNAATSSVKETNKSFLGQTSNGVSTVYGDTKNGISTMYNDVKSVAPDAKAAMKEIYNTIKDVSLYSWNLLVYQQRVWSICYLFCELLFFYSVYRFWQAYDKYSDTDLDESGITKSKNIIPCIILGVSSLILGYFSFIHFEAMITGFFNPEFGALRQLVELGKTIK
jgi:hypothetical protein